jgi:AraC-like DNA-binding protein
MIDLTITHRPKNEDKFTNTVRLVFMIVLVLSGHILPANAQIEKRFKDQPLEESLQKNEVGNAKELLDKKLALQDRLNLEQQVYYLNRKSQLELMQGTYLESLATAKKSESLLANDPNSRLLGETFRAICYAYIRTGKLDSALIYAEKLYDFTQSNGDKILKRAALIALGNISLQNKAYQKSLEFYSEALQITESLKDSLNLKVDYYNVGLAWAQLHEHQKSNEFLFKSIQRAEKENTMDLLARAYGSVADNYLSQKNYEGMETYVKKANEIAQKIGNSQLLAMGLASLTEAAIFRKNYSQAIVVGKESLKHLQDRPVIQLQAKVDSMLYIAYKLTGDYQSALDQLESYDEKRLKIRSETQKAKLDQLTLAYEVDKKDLLIQNQTITLQKEMAKNRLLGFGLLFISVLGVLLIYINNKNSITRKVLFRKEKEIDLQLSHIGPLMRVNNQKEVFDLDIKPVEGLEHKKLFGEILALIKEKKLYLDPKFNQQTLVGEFGTNRQYLYEAISKNGEDNFRGLINRLRINEAKEIIFEKIKNSENIDFTDLSENVGFNSYTTFYRAFKHLTGLTPNEFSREFKKELVYSKYN